MTISAVQHMIVLSSSEREAAMALNGVEVGVDPRAIDHPNPGVRPNLNDLATSYRLGDPVVLKGAFVVEKQTVDNLEYQLYAPSLVTLLSTLPTCLLELQTVFAPTEP